jgi:hypothetical protein
MQADHYRMVAPEVLGFKSFFFEFIRRQRRNSRVFRKISNQTLHETGRRRYNRRGETPIMFMSKWEIPAVEQSVRNFHFSSWPASQFRGTGSPK